MKNFLGGWHKYMRELFVLIAPTINSYRRHQDGSWAPNTTTWGIENRTTGFRVVGNGKGIHLENRLPGGDANVYLSIAALIVAGLAGVDEDLDCGEPYKGNAYECKAAEYGIPHSLREAVELFRGSAIARKFLGDAVVDHYVAVYTAESDAYERHVSSWEVAYYFDQI
jgi:glutamine synthetase